MLWLNIIRPRIEFNSYCTLEYAFNMIIPNDSYGKYLDAVISKAILKSSFTNRTTDVGFAFGIYWLVRLPFKEKIFVNDHSAISLWASIILSECYLPSMLFIDRVLLEQIIRNHSANITWLSTRLKRTGRTGSAALQSTYADGPQRITRRVFLNSQVILFKQEDP